MKLSYCKGCKQTPIIPVIGVILSSAVDDKGVSHVVEALEKFDNEKYGSFRDWSLDAMVKAGISPESFSSPSVVGSRLNVASSVQNIDLSSLDSQE